MQTILLQPLHTNQQAIIDNRKRFNVLKCGRRFGKTSLVERLAGIPSLRGYPVAIYTPTYKDVSDVWQHIKTVLAPAIKQKDEQLKQIRLISGGVIDFWSMDDPDSGRGRKYARVIMDECEKARHFKTAWQQTIRATLADYKGDAWFLSTPKFGQTYFKEIFHQAQNKANWAAFKFTTYDNPFIDPAEIDEARLQLDELTFLCEFMAEDVDVTLRPFAYAFSKAKHVKPVEHDVMQPTFISFDFNVDPITAVVSQNPDVGVVRIIREYALANSDIYELCTRIKSDYPNCLLIITGDATGQNRSALVRGNLNYYTVIRQELGVSDNQIRIPTVNPAVKDTRVLLNSILQNGDFAISPDCPLTIRDLEYVQVDDKGDIEKDRSTDLKNADLLDNIRYTCSMFHKEFLTISVLKEFDESEDI